MLEFTTKCPQPASLWKTLSVETISPAQGYSADQIRFMMFMDLSLSIDFTLAKKRTDNALKNINQLSTIYASLSIQLKNQYNLNFSSIDFQKLKPIEDMTDVVLLDNLDIPSIFIRQLLYGRDVTTSMKLIEDLFHIDYTHTHMGHLRTDILAAPGDITMYQLNTSEPFQYFDKFTIDSSLPKLSITCKEDIDTHMKAEVADAIYNSKIGMIPIDTPLVIPEFMLTTPAKETEYSPKDEPSASSWEDVRVGTKLRCTSTGTADREVGKIYKITSIEDDKIFVSSDTSHSSGYAAYWKPHFTIEEI